MVYHYNKFQRSFFRKLPFGSEYWDSTNLATAPSVKVGRKARMTGLSGGVLTTAAVSPTLAVVRVPRRLRIQDH